MHFLARIFSQNRKESFTRRIYFFLQLCVKNNSLSLPHNSVTGRRQPQKTQICRVLILKTQVVIEISKKKYSYVDFTIGMEDILFTVHVSPTENSTHYK